MRSLVIIEVEHGETTDPLTEYLDIVPGTNEAYPHEQEGLQVLDYSVRVDLPPYITARSLTTHGLPSA